MYIFVQFKVSSIIVCSLSKSPPSSLTYTIALNAPRERKILLIEDQHSYTSYNHLTFEFNTNDFFSLIKFDLNKNVTRPPKMDRGRQSIDNSFGTPSNQVT